MERAGRGVVEAVFEEWPDLAKAPHRAVVLCGPGNNGGDGFVVARLLHDRGWQVEAFLYGNPEKLPPDAKTNYLRWCDMAAARPLADFLVRESWQCDVIFDALFGTGLQRPIDGEDMWELMWELTDASDIVCDTPPEYQASLKPHPPPRVVAVDIPSGLNTDTGEVVGGDPEHGCRASRAALTVSFHRMKQGHVLGEGPHLCGKVVVKDIGL